MCSPFSVNIFTSTLLSVCTENIVHLKTHIPHTIIISNYHGRIQCQLDLRVKGAQPNFKELSAFNDTVLEDGYAGTLWHIIGKPAKLKGFSCSHKVNTICQ